MAYTNLTNNTVTLTFAIGKLVALIALTCVAADQVDACAVGTQGCVVFAFVNIL